MVNYRLCSKKNSIQISNQGAIVTDNNYPSQLIFIFEICILHRVESDHLFKKVHSVHIITTTERFT